MSEQQLSLPLGEIVAQQTTPDNLFTLEYIADNNLFILSIDHLNLGNNFTYQHMVNAIEEHPLIEEISDALHLHVYSDSDVVICAPVNFGFVIREHTCASDLLDHMPVYGLQ